MPSSRTPWAASFEDVVGALSSDIALGLSSEEVRVRRAKGGPNSLYEKPRASTLRRLLQQFADVTVLSLLAAAGISTALGFNAEGSLGLLERFGDTIAILAIVLINAGIGFVQENRAHRALSALTSLVAPTAVVWRDGKRTVLPAEALVVGDILDLQEGARIPADARICSASGLQVSEAVLTGESTPVTKRVEPVGEGAALGDRSSMVFMATHIHTGTATAVVTAIGMETEMGGIAKMLATVTEEPTPLEREMGRFGLRIVFGCVILSAALFAIGWWQGHLPIPFLALTAVSLAVAAIPEGLPAITTVVLAQGVRRMAQGNALVRRLAAVETLGSAQIICTDKTGTLTQNRMTVTRMWADGCSWDGTGPVDEALRHLVELFAYVPVTRAEDTEPAEPDSGDTAHSDGVNGDAVNGGSVQGDPTDVAIYRAFVESGRSMKADVVGSLPFSPERQLASALVLEAAQYRLVAHGAPEQVLTRCRDYLAAPERRPLTDQFRKGVLETIQAWTSSGLRVLAFAQRDLAARAVESGVTPDDESDLTFIGLVALSDPTRPEVAEAIAQARGAGVATLMITGDHANTAAKIATELGFLGPEHEVVTGPELARLDDAELSDKIGRIAVVARATAGDKLRVVQALRARGVVVAMTGDGVNDAPAIKAATIGVAMGKMGTDVARDVADLVLADDNYATIVRAIREGRAIYSGIQRFVAFLFAANLGLVLLVTVGVLLGWPALLTPTQILWINLVTNGLPALAIGTEPTQDNPMSRAPRRPGAALLTRHHWVAVSVVGCWLALLGGVVFHWAAEPLGLNRARTLVFCVLAVAPLAYALSARQGQRLTWSSLGGSRALLGALLVSLVLQVISIYLTPAQAVFKSVPLSVQEVLVVLGCSLSVLGLGELLKVLRIQS